MGDIKADVKTDVGKGEVKDVPFDNILNFRDVGKTINEFLGEKYICSHSPRAAALIQSHRRIAEGNIFRSARPDDAAISDRIRLRNSYGIKTIIDLRTVYVALLPPPSHSLTPNA